MQSVYFWAKRESFAINKQAAAVHVCDPRAAKCVDDRRTVPASLVCLASRRVSRVAWRDWRASDDGDREAGDQCLFGRSIRRPPQAASQPGRLSRRAARRAEHSFAISQDGRAAAASATPRNARLAKMTSVPFSRGTPLATPVLPQLPASRRLEPP